MYVAYPLLDEVATATPEQIVRWTRFLPVASTHEEVRVVAAVIDARHTIPKEYLVAASKQVGWKT
jgi:hypothetical protein